MAGSRATAAVGGRPAPSPSGVGGGQPLISGGFGGVGPTGAGGGGSPFGGATDMGSGGACASGFAETPTGFPNQYGFALKDSYFLVPCVEQQSRKCLTMIGACPNQAAASFEERGYRFVEEFKLGGCPGQTYNVTIRVNGIAEGKYYQGGQRRRGADFSDAQAPEGSDAWHVGGSPIESTHNVFKLSVYQPDGRTEVQHYYLNSFPQVSGAESTMTFPLGYEATFEVPAEGVVQYLSQDSDCQAIDNCGPGNDTASCSAGRAVPNEPGLAVPVMYGGHPVSGLNVVNGAQQPFHSQMIHVTLANVELKP